MRKVLSAFLCLLSLGFAFQSPASANISVEFKTSRIHGLYYFLNSISDDPYASGELKKIFEKSPYNTPENQLKIEEYSNAISVLQNSYEYDGFPQGRHNGQSLNNLFEIETAFSNSLDDLSERALGLLNASSQSRLFASMAQWENIYNDLIWNPSFDKLVAYKAKLETGTQQWKMEYVLNQAAKFYNSDWPSDLPFTIGLIPIPLAKGRTSGGSLGTFETIEVLLDETEIFHRYGVIVHEMAHSLFGAQSMQFQSELENMFNSVQSPYAKYAYKLLNEGLATAVGNGWAYEIATGTINQGSWYNDYYINTFAKGIYDKTKEYLAQGKSIDADFVKFAIDKYAELFPNAFREYTNIMSSILLVTDENIYSNGGQVRSTLRKYFNINGLSMSAPADSPITFENYKGSDNTAVFILTRQSISQLNPYLESIPHLQELLDKVGNTDKNLLFSTLNQNNRANIVLILNSVNDLQTGLALMQSLKTIDASKPMAEF